MNKAANPFVAGVGPIHLALFGDDDIDVEVEVLEVRSSIKTSSQSQLAISKSISHSRFLE